MSCRNEIHKILEWLVVNDMKLCRDENVEQHCWKLLYYNIIELLKKYVSSLTTNNNNKDNKTNNNMTSVASTDKFNIKEICLQIIDDGLKQFENILKVLETHYKFSLEDFLDKNAGGNIVDLIIIIINNNK